jgi:hypothetical protein
MALLLRKPPSHHDPKNDQWSANAGPPNGAIFCTQPARPPEVPHVVHQLAQLSTHFTHSLKSAGVGAAKGVGFGGVGGGCQGLVLLLLLLLFLLTPPLLLPLPEPLGQTLLPDLQSLGTLVGGVLGPPGTGSDFWVLVWWVVLGC